jgi:hypothetical protein
MLALRHRGRVAYYMSNVAIHRDHDAEWHGSQRRDELGESIARFWDANFTLRSVTVPKEGPNIRGIAVAHKHLFEGCKDSRVLGHLPNLVKLSTNHDKSTPFHFRVALFGFGTPKCCAYRRCICGKEHVTTACNLKAKDPDGTYC